MLICSVCMRLSSKPRWIFAQCDNVIGSCWKELKNPVVDSICRNQDTDEENLKAFPESLVKMNSIHILWCFNIFDKTV